MNQTIHFAITGGSSLSNCPNNFRLSSCGFFIYKTKLSDDPGEVTCRACIKSFQFQKAIKRSPQRTPQSSPAIIQKSGNNRKSKTQKSRRRPWEMPRCFELHVESVSFNSNITRVVNYCPRLSKYTFETDISNLPPVLLDKIKPGVRIKTYLWYSSNQLWTIGVGNETVTYLWKGHPYFSKEHSNGKPLEQT